MRRLLMNIGYAARRRLLGLLRWRTSGVKVMAFDPDGQLLLVRHGYGRSDLWLLPGGGVGRRETTAVAARRELMEEVGCTLDRLELVGTYTSTAEGKRDTIDLFRGVTADKPRPDGWEVVEARFFPIDALPATTSPATLRRVAEVKSGVIGAEW